MASYNPPTENITQFNTSLFNQPEEILSQAEADTLYLSKKNTDTSTAPLTTYNGEVAVKGNTNFGVQGVAGGICNVNRRFRINDVNGNATGYLDVVYGNGAECLYTSQSLSLAQTFHRFYNCASGNATPVLRLEIGDMTKIPNGLEVGTNGVGGINARAGINFSNISSPYTDTFCQLYPTNNFMNYIMNAGTTTNSFHSFYAYNNANASREAFRVGYDNVTINDTGNLNARLIKSTSSAAAHTLFDNMTSGGVLTIGNSASTNTINGVTTFNQNINANADIVCFDKNSPFTNTLTINHTGSSANYTSFAGPTNNSFHNFTAYNNAGLSNISLQVGYTQVNIPDLSTRLITSISNTSAHTLFTNMVSPAVLTIGGTTSTNTIQGQTTFTQLVTASNNINTNSINGVLNTGTKSLYTSLTGTLNIGQPTTALINVKGPTTFDVTTTMTGDLILSRTKNTSTYATYNGLTSTYIGYFSEIIQSFATGITSATRETVGSITNNTIGWWRIDFEVATICGAAGSITQSRTFVSDNLVSLTTPINISGAKHTNFATQTYAIGEISYENGSFMYLSDGTSKTLGLQFYRTFATGTFTYTGSIRQIRMN